MKKKTNKKMGYLLIIPFILFNFLFFYLFLPTISIKNFGMWVIVILDLVLIMAFLSIINAKEANFFKKLKVMIYVLVTAVVVMLLGALLSSQIFNAKAYTKILDIQTVEHVSLPTENELNSIPLMDTESSKVLGNRKIGALNEIVSQFEVSDDYMTIAYNNEPVKVAPLKYAGLWKWLANKNNGIPGYILVNPNALTAEYIQLTEGMKYVPSAYFNEDLARYIYFKYPTTFFDNLHLEIDDQGKPYYVASTYEHSIGLFGGKKITGAIVVDPVNGEINKYALNEIPSFVDIVFNGDYIAKYFDIHGRLLNGFLNSIFGQKGLIESTTTTFYDSSGDTYRKNDFGYIVKDNEIYIYTGVTAVTNDESNIGYLMASEATGKIEISYFESTDEDSVMRAAEGEVQEKGYRASFPSLLNIGGDPAYVMVLKDNLGLVKMYAIVDAAQYSHMVVDDDLNRALSKFSKNILGDMQEKTITVKRIELINNAGDTYIYLVDDEKNIYVGEFDQRILLVEELSQITIQTDGNKFYLK